MTRIFNLKATVLTATGFLVAVLTMAMVHPVQAQVTWPTAPYSDGSCPAGWFNTGLIGCCPSGTMNIHDHCDTKADHEGATANYLKCLAIAASQTVGDPASYAAAAAACTQN